MSAPQEPSVRKQICDADDAAEAWLQSLDRTEKIGSRHHTVPAFYLKRWALSDGKVRVYSRADAKFSIRNIRDLGIKDFHTFINVDGAADSRMEMLLSRIEDDAAAVLDALLSSFQPISTLTAEQSLALATFVGFQMARGPRRRREEELMVEYWVKTQLRGTVPEVDLGNLRFAPHQNEHIGDMGDQAQRATKNIATRPLCLIVLDRPLLFTSDEPVIIHTDRTHVRHHPDCALTDAEIEARLARERKKKKRRQRDVKRVVHIASSQPRGIAHAVEIVLPLSPRTALVYGPPDGWAGDIARERLDGLAADTFAQRVNEQMLRYALDIVVAHPADEVFLRTPMPSLEPLLAVCDGTNAASKSINRVPIPLRTQRLWRPQ